MVATGRQRGKSVREAAVAADLITAAPFLTHQMMDPLMHRVVEAGELVEHIEVVISIISGLDLRGIHCTQS